MDRPELARIQTALTEAGHDAGPADGLTGPRTVAALRSFQRAHGLPITGEPDEATQSQLFAPLDRPVSRRSAIVVAVLAIAATFVPAIAHVDADAVVQAIDALFEGSG